MQGVRRKVAGGQPESRRAVMHTWEAFVYNCVPKQEASGPVSHRTVLKGLVL